jgi:chemotaxis protein CheC
VSNTKTNRSINVNTPTHPYTIITAGKEGKISDKDVLLEIGSMGAGHATIALSTILHEKVNVEVPQFHTKPPHLVPKIYAQHDTPVAAIFMQLRSNIECDIMVIFEAEEAQKIASLMASNAEENGADEDIENSAIEELGSIMIGSFLNAVANFVGTELIPTPPQLIFDAFDAVMDELLAKQALCSDVAAIFDARFKRSTSSAEGYLILFPGASLKKILAKRGRTWLSDDEQKKKTPLISVH